MSSSSFPRCGREDGRWSERIRAQLAPRDRQDQELLARIWAERTRVPNETACSTTKLKDLHRYLIDELRSEPDPVKAYGWILRVELVEDELDYRQRVVVRPDRPSSTNGK